MSLYLTPTRAEQELAARRIREWHPDDRASVILLPANEREHVILLVALLDAKPSETTKEGAQ